MFLKKVSLMKGCIYFNKNKVKTIILCNIIAPVFVSRDPSETILIRRFAAQKTFLIIINFGSSCAA